MYCRQCHYNLHGLTEYRCPECGRAFDPVKPGSFYTKLPTIGGRLSDSLQSNIHWREWIAASFCLFWLFVLFIPATSSVRGRPAPKRQHLPASQNNLTTILGVWKDQQNDSPTPRRSFNKQDAQAIMQPSLSLWTQYNLFEQRRHFRHSLGEAAFFAIPLATIMGTIAILWGGWVRRIAGVLALLLILVSMSSRAAGFLGTVLVPGSHAFLDDYVFLDDVDLRNPRGAIAAYDWRGPAQGWPYVVAFDDGRVEILYDVQAKPLFEQQGIPYPEPKETKK